MYAIVAVSKNWGIGRNNALLFSIPEDMKYFREMTAGKTIIMGRNTLESFPNGAPLKNRRNIIISTNEDYKVEGAEIVHSPAQALELLSDLPEDEVYVVGGSEVYRAMLPFCEKAFVTKVLKSSEADRFFPDLDSLSDWKLAQVSEEKEHEGLKYRFCVYERI
ncbi:MAG: diacylglycerol kinase [Firmicutes bacterium HGW-Firmicutes-16]|nr:MAG: diacylglycerol kinase [Firmicutes bacterium HGW-Firmicutes-16]